MSEFVIETQHLYKRFGQVTALENINIQIRQGEFIAIMGASGSGKTTLMNILTGLDTASEGKVILDGVDAAQLDEIGRQRFRAEKIGLVFQQFHLIPYLTALIASSFTNLFFMDFLFYKFSVMEINNSIG